MEFKSLKNIETSFRQIRLFGIVFVVMCTLTTGYAVWNSYTFAEAQRQKIYVLGRRQIVDACAFARPDTKPSGRSKGTREAFPRTLFHAVTLIRTLSKAISNGRCSLPTRAHLTITVTSRKKGYYNRIISGNISQTIQIDSVSCNFDVYPYAVATYARQMIIRESSVTERSLVTRCRLLNAVRSDNNPHGFMMESFEITENKDLNTIKR